MLLSDEFKEDKINFFILYAGFAIAAGIFFGFPYRPNVQKYVAIYIGLYYFFWGIWHHHQKQDLCVKVALEYFLFALLGSSIILATILRV